MLQKWRDHGAITYAGYISASPATPRNRSFATSAIIKRELPLDILEFFFLTPLPGSEDHKVLWTKGVWMDPDMNKYDLNHRVSHHPKMSDAEWEEAYRAAWHTFYTPDHVRTILRRSAACKLGRPNTTLSTILWFYLMIIFEGVHPLEGGAFRLKFRRDRRHGLQARKPVGVLSALRVRNRPQAVGLLASLSAVQGHARRGADGARPLDLQRPRDRAAQAGRVRGARALSRDQWRRGRAGPQAPRRRDPRSRPRARHAGDRLHAGVAAQGAKGPRAPAPTH